LPGEEYYSEDAVVNGAAEDDQQRDEKLKPGVDVSTVSKWEAFFQGTEYIQKVREVADLYPELRSVNVVYADLDRFDADLAAYLLDHPDLCLLAGKQALKNLMHQEMRTADINLRLINLPRDSRVEIRDLRAKHVGKLVSVEGLVRKATEVRPKITDALFQCLRCGHVIKEAQEGLFFKEPMECYKEQDGCGRSAGSTKFKLLTEESRFVDTQKVEVQESPEGLRGGAQPERLTGYLEDDAAGSVSPGDRVILNGILRSVQKGQPAKSTLFDINLDIIAAESQRTEYEEIHITPEDEARIVEVAHSPDVFKKIVASISPSIFGYDVEKESLALQLFGGVPKNLDDGTRIRGDIHILLIGDPGVAKCVTGDTKVLLSDGRMEQIQKLMEEAESTGAIERIDDGITIKTSIGVMSLTEDGRIAPAKADLIWKRKAPNKMIKVRTKSGKQIVVTPTHPFFTWEDGLVGIEAKKIRVGDFLVAPRSTEIWGESQPLQKIKYEKSRANNKRELMLPEKTTPEFWRFVGLMMGEGYVQTLKQNSGTSYFTNNDDDLLEEVKNFAFSLGLEPKLRQSHPEKTAKEVYFCGLEQATFLNQMLGGTSSSKRWPSILFQCPEDEVAAAISGLFDAEGSVSLDSRKLSIASASRELMEDTQYLLLRMGIQSRVKEFMNKQYGRKYFRLMIGGSEVTTFWNKIPIRGKDKKERLLKLTQLEVDYNTNLDVVPKVNKGIERIRKELGLLQKEMGVPRPTMVHYEAGDRNPSIQAFRTIMDSLMNAWKSSDKVLSVETEKLMLRMVELSRANIYWEQVEDVEEIEPEETVVYDLQVEKWHNFIANGLVVHNSQMLRYMSKLAPRGIYASGKSSSAAGLCVAPETVIVVDGSPTRIGDFVESRIRSPVEELPGQWSEKVTDQCFVATMSDGRQTSREVEAIWRIKTPSFLVELEDISGNRLTLTPETRVWSKPDGVREGWVKASDMAVGQPIMVSDNETYFRWSRVGRVYRRDGGLPPFVYDLTVRDSHSFLANGFVVHNTAAAVKDDFGEGRWTLEAGALVLADLGLASIDEMDKMTDQDRSSMHEAMESQCYDETTEVLTDHGWKYFRDVDRSDLVASLSAEGELKFVKPAMYVDVRREGDMYRLRGRSVDLMVTPNHNMYVSVAGEEGFGPYSLRRMDELPTSCKLRFQTSASWEGKETELFTIPAVPGSNGRPRELPMDDWLELLGYYLAAGRVHRKDGEPDSIIIGNLSTSSKEECIGGCLERLGLKQVLEDGEIVVHDRPLAAYLASLGRKDEEHIPREVLVLPPRQLRILYEALMLGYEGPGRGSGQELRTRSKRLADDLQELALRIGMSAQISVSIPGRYRSRSRSGYEADVPRYTVTMLQSEDGGAVEVEIDPSQPHAVERVPYRGRVYCVEVPDHVLYVRRNGKALWCGNTVSVAKAGITATLQCRCSLLGAANPKYGRFQEHQYIAEQINMPPALLSRFDLIFALTDKPSVDKDASITQHILKSHRRGQVRKYADPSALTGVDGEKILSDTTAMQPVLERDFFRKYVAYSKKIFPVLSDEAMAIISQFYLKIRKQGEGEGASVPITARQLEAFVRLSEASARARLSPVVTADDAQRAVRIVEYYLRRIAGEGDKLDFDIIATGTSHSQREQIGIIKKLISQLSKSADSKKGVPADEIYKSALAEGIAEDRAKTLIKRLGQNGEIYSPAPGFYKLASEG